MQEFRLPPWLSPSPGPCQRSTNQDLRDQKCGSENPLLGAALKRKSQPSPVWYPRLSAPKHSSFRGRERARRLWVSDFKTDLDSSSALAPSIKDKHPSPRTLRSLRERKPASRIPQVKQQSTREHGDILFSQVQILKRRRLRAKPAALLLTAPSPQEERGAREQGGGDAALAWGYF